MKAYSYSRYSSDAQKHGTSIDRQQTLARKWCKDKGIELSDQTYSDEAVSGFQGANARTGALSQFIADRESGVVEAGSYLILENLDRLTRMEPWDAVALLQRLQGLEITVVTLRPEIVFSPEKRDSMQLLQAVLSLDNAHKESARKSDLGKIEWAKRFARARESGHHIGKRVSNWLTLGKDGKYHLNEHADTVREIFRLCVEGLGSTAIAQALNSEPERFKTFNNGGRWGTSAVLTILKSRAAVGELALKDGGGPVLNYFPAVVDAETFDAAKNIVKVRETGQVTKQSADFNVLRKLVVCGACGSAMNIIHRTKFRYLMCANRRYGACEGSKNVRLDESEDVLMAMLLHLDALSLVMPDPDKLNRELQAAEGRLLTEREKLVIWTDKLEQHPLVDTYHKLVIESTGRINALKADIERLTGELTGGEKLDWQQIRAKIDLKDKPTRRRVNAFLHRLGVQVRIAEGYLLVQHGVAVAMFAVEKNRIGYIALDNDMSEPWESEEMPEGLVLTRGVGEAPRLQQANELAAGVKRRLSKGGIGGSAVGTLTVPNGRGTRRAKSDSPH
jgi:DNA invertase Pin-like site-specific DNA recombinase